MNSSRIAFAMVALGLSSSYVEASEITASFTGVVRSSTLSNVFNGSPVGLPFTATVAYDPQSFKINRPDEYPGPGGNIFPPGRSFEGGNASFTLVVGGVTLASGLVANQQMVVLQYSDNHPFSSGSTLSDIYEIAVRGSLTNLPPVTIGHTVFNPTEEIELNLTVSSRLLDFLPNFVDPTSPNFTLDGTQLNGPFGGGLVQVSSSPALDPLPMGGLGLDIEHVTVGQSESTGSGSAVPEPGTLGILGFALGLLGLLRCWRVC